MKMRTRLLVSFLIWVLTLALSVTAISAFASGTSAASGDTDTKYGTVPAANVGNVFVLFDGERNFLSGTDSWASANASAREWLAANPGKTVNILVQDDYTVTRAVAAANWLGHMNGEVVYDLGGHTIIADADLFSAGLYNASADIPASTKITVKNGTLLQGKGYIFTCYNKANANKSMSYIFDNVTFGFHTATALANHEIMIRGWGNDDASGGDLILDMTFTSCTFDVSAFPASGTDTNNQNYAAKTPTVFFSGAAVAKSDVIMNIKVYGGEFIVGTTNKITMVNGNATPTTVFYPDNDGNCVTVSVVNGQTPTGTVPTEAGSLSFTKLVTDGTDRDVYTIPSATGRPVATKYGDIPAKYELCKFAVFNANGFVAAATEWNELHTAMREYLAKNAGNTVYVLVRENYNVTSAISSENWLGQMNGTIVFDLDGKTMSANASGAGGIFMAGLYTEAAASFKTNVTVKNGTLLMGLGSVVSLQNIPVKDKTLNLTFEDCSFGIDAANAKQNVIFFGWQGSAGDGTLVCNLKLDGCTIDTGAWPAGNSSQSQVVVIYKRHADTAVQFNAEFVGGALKDLAHIPLNLSNFGNNQSSLIFTPDDEGNYMTLTVKNGFMPSLAVSTDMGLLSFSKLIHDGLEQDVYAFPTLTGNPIATDYGTIPAQYEASIFAIFGGGEFLAGVGTWREVNTQVMAALAADPTRQVQVLLRQDYTVNVGFNGSEWCGHLDGEVLYDLGGYTMIADANIFEAGINTSYTGNYATTVTVKNGTLLNGKGLVFSVSNKPGVAKKVNFTFEDCTFGFNPATITNSKDILFFFWKTASNGSGVMNFNLTLDECVFDVRGWPDSFNKQATLIYHQDDVDIHPNIRILGGSFITDNVDNLAIYSLTGGDSILFMVGDDGRYATLDVPNGADPSLVSVPGNGATLAFNLLVSDGSERDVYILNTCVNIDTKNLIYVEYNGKKMYVGPFNIPTGATYKAVYLNASDYSGIVTTETTNSIRLSESAGLRFATRLDTALLDKLYAYLEAGDVLRVEFGTLIAPVDYVGTSGLTVEALAQAGKAYLEVLADYGDYYAFDTNASTTHFVGSIIDLYEHNIDRTFLGRGFVRVTLKSRQDIIIYSPVTQGANIQSVAADLLKKTDYVAQLSAAQKSILETFKAGELPPLAEGVEENRQIHGLNVLSLGDSLFYGSGLSSRSQQWIAMLARECNWNLTNLGKGGWTIGYTPAVEDRSMYYHLMNDSRYVYGNTNYYNTGNATSKSAEDVDLILLEGGNNDYTANIPLGTTDSTDCGTVLGAMRLMVDRLLEIYPNATVVLITSWHTEGTRTINGETAYRIDYTANGMKNLYADVYQDNDRVKLIDAGDPALTDIHMYDPEWRAVYSNSVSDINHLNSEGMRIMAQHMLPLLKKELFGIEE